MEVRQETMIRPSRQHVPNIHGNSSDHWVHFEPRGAVRCFRIGVGRALEALIPRKLEQKRQSTPICVWPCPPVVGWKRFRLDRRVVQQPQRALAVMHPQVVCRAQGARCHFRASLGLQDVQESVSQLVCGLHELVGSCLEVFGLLRPTSIYGSTPGGNLKALLLIGSAGGRAHLRKVLVASVQVFGERALLLLLLLALIEELS
mmetsp:Transcript_63674/g.149248  ORF Transcript_63674/g.149248 Transcript_63674/m.149248 type:complete len:203 (+) Transcript_63674:212-820(+)